jgi:hypothetical protein
MLNLIGPAQHEGGVSRRTVLKAGFLSLAGLSLSDCLRAKAMASGSGPATGAKDTAVILMFLGGGPSHMDTYDMKPEAPVEYRGEFKPIETNVQGVLISEHLPLQARHMDKMALVRTVNHSSGAHGMASHGVLTGYMPPLDSTDTFNPSCGSVTARLRGAGGRSLPAYVCLPSNPPASGAAYLGAAYNPFSSGGDPNDPEFRVRDLKINPRLDIERVQDRRSLLASLDAFRRDADLDGTAAGYDQFYRDAFEIVTGSACRDAFDIQQEDPRLRDRYGRDTFGQSTLMARRLVEAGVPFVTVNCPFSWDTHSDNFATLKNTNLPAFDQSLSALVEDLHTRGLSGRVLVVAYGEFGRTPRVNGTAGRDHWPGAMSVVLAGGGLRTGLVVGSTDAKGENPKTRPVGPQDVLATVYHVLGIDFRHEFRDAGQRPIPVLNEGRPIAELI